MIYPDEIHDELKRLNKRAEQIGKPSNNKEALELALILSKTAEIQGQWHMDMLDNKVDVKYCYEMQSLSREYIINRLQYWHKQLGLALDHVGLYANKVDPKEHERMLIQLNEWDYILNYIIRTKN